MVLLFSRLWVTHPAGLGFDFIIIVPLLPSHGSFFFVFGCRVFFLGEFQHSPVDGYSTARCDFGALTGGDEYMCFYSSMLNKKPKIFVLLGFSFPSFFFLFFFFAFFVVASGWETYSLTEEVWLEKIALYLKLRIILFLFEVL